MVRDDLSGHPNRESLVVHCHSSMFESSNARQKFLSSVIQNINVTNQLWIKVPSSLSSSKTTTSINTKEDTTTTHVKSDDDNRMVIEMLDTVMMSSCQSSPSSFNPNEIYICDIGPTSMSGLRKFYKNDTISTSTASSSTIRKLTIQLGCQYLSPGCHQKHQWTLSDVTNLVSIFDTVDNNVSVNNNNSSPSKVHVRINQGALIKDLMHHHHQQQQQQQQQQPGSTTMTIVATSNHSIVSRILKAIEEASSASSSVKGQLEQRGQGVGASGISGLALIGFQTPPDCYKLLKSFLKRNHNIEQLIPIWKPSGLTSQQKLHITKLCQLNQDIKRFMTQGRRQQERHQSDIQPTSVIVLPSNLWSPFFTKVAKLSPSKLFHLLREGSDFIFGDVSHYY